MNNLESFFEIKIFALTLISEAENTSSNAEWTKPIRISWYKAVRKMGEMNERCEI